MKLTASKSGCSSRGDEHPVAAEPCPPPTHIRYLPTGEVARIIDLKPDEDGKIKCEFANGERAGVSRKQYEVIANGEAIAEYERNRSLWRSLAFFNPIEG